MADHHHGQVVVTADLGIDLDGQIWLHSVFACPLHRDICVALTEYAMTTDLVQAGISVPGSADAAKTVSRALPCLLRLLRQWYEVVWNFSCENFVLYRPKQRHQFMMLILEDFPSFAAFLHWRVIMFRAGELVFLHLETTMG